jgi:hypothetical protein
MGIERLDDMPPGTLGFRATDEIEREDYDAPQRLPGGGYGPIVR